VEASFQYQEKLILKNVNLRISNKETIAFVGESGSGKTTLVNILAGLLPLNEGQFLINGKLSSEVNINSFQDKLAYITQYLVIFNDSISNNVSFWAEPTT